MRLSDCGSKLWIHREELGLRFAEKEREREREGAGEMVSRIQLLTGRSRGTWVVNLTVERVEREGERGREKLFSPFDGYCLVAIVCFPNSSTFYSVRI